MWSLNQSSSIGCFNKLECLDLFDHLTVDNRVYYVWVNHCFECKLTWPLSESSYFASLSYTTGVHCYRRWRELESKSYPWVL